MVFKKSDEQLIAAALKGHKKAWLNLVKRYEQGLFNYAQRMTGNQDDALDLLQEVFMAVFRNLPTFRGDASFKSWLYRIAHYRCMEFYRRKRQHLDLDEADEPVCAQPCPEQRHGEQQQNKQLAQAMQQLPFAQKAVVELKFFGQFTFEEIAEQLDISTNTAKSRLYAALEKLRTLMEVEYV